MTQSAGPQGGQRPGRMTAVMRAMPVATGPKVLRIGLVQGGKVIEERVIKQRSTVTVGPSEKNTFVVLGAGAIPSTFKLFELVGQDYFLNFVDGMGGRVALQTGVSDLNALKGQARRVQIGDVTAYQAKLTDDSRGKVVIGETTFLFQFVAPPPLQPKPQLPSSVKSGIADEIDWSMTIIAAFSFLIHFGAVGSMYSDWADRVLPDEGDVKGLVSMVKNLPPPPPAEKPPEEDTSKDDKKDDKQEKQVAKPSSASGGGKAAAGGPAGKGGSGRPVSGAEAAAIGKQLAAMEAQVLGVVGSGPAAANVLADGNVPTGSLDTFAKQDVAVGAGGPGGLKTGVAGGPVGTGDRPGLGDGIPAGKASGSTGSGTTTTVAAPKASVGGGGSVSGGKINNASRVIALARAKARACYQQGLSSNPDMEGRASFTLTISGSGSVSSASVSPSGSLSPAVASCIKGALSGLSFDPPEGGAATVSGSFSFVNANKGKLRRGAGHTVP